MLLLLSFIFSVLPNLSNSTSELSRDWGEKLCWESMFENHIGCWPQTLDCPFHPHYYLNPLDNWRGNWSTRWDCNPSTRVSEVMICENPKVIYVQNVRAGSTTIRTELGRLFNATFYHTEGFSNERITLVDGGTVTSRHLSSEMLKDYFVFTFVREPLKRYISALVQASTITGIEVNQLAQFYSDGCTVDVHLQSQTKCISGTTSDDKVLAYDFIGRVEEFDNEWAHVLNRLNVSHDGGTVPRLNSRPTRYANFHESNLTEDSLERICSIIRGDYECFGYQTPAVCGGL